MRLSFLPTFFVCLAIAFSLALWIRVRSYRSPPLVMVPNAAARQPQPGPAAEIEHTGRNPFRAVPRESPAPPVAPSAVPGRAIAPPEAAPIAADEPPRMFEAVWWDPRSIRTGETNALHVRTAARAGIRQISGTIVSSSGTARIPLRCSASADREWVCQVSVPSCVACGRWAIEQLTVGTEGNVTTIPGSNPDLAHAAVQLWGGRCDADPPALHAITIGEGDAGNGDSIVVALTASDATCGVAGIKVVLASAGGETLTLTGVPGGDEDSWVARSLISRSTPRGAWHVSSVEVTDQAGNVKSYGEADPLLHSADLTIP